MSITSNIYNINTTFPSPQGTCHLGKRQNHAFILYKLHVIFMHILDGVVMQILDVLIRIHIIDLLLLLLLLLLLQQPAGAWPRRTSTLGRTQKLRI